MPYAYIGIDERVYPAYLAVLPDGSTRTLTGRPGADPVDIRPAAGSRTTSQVPADGLWIKVTGDGDTPTNPAAVGDREPVGPDPNAPVATPAEPPTSKPVRTARKATQS